MVKIGVKCKDSIEGKIQDYNLQSGLRVKYLARIQVQDEFQD
jgi:hypothetical protein